MRYKKILLAICIVTCILFTVSSAVASDVDDTAISKDNTTNIAEENDLEITASSLNDDIIGDDANTFTELQKKINEADEGATITLDRDYAYDDGFDTNGIEISKPITIDGNNHVLDGKSKSKIFRSEGSSVFLADFPVVLKNIKFINGWASQRGSAVDDFWGANYDISFCSFVNCGGSENWGSTVFLAGATGHITSCNFENCLNPVSIGGVRAGDSTITSCSFSNCRLPVDAMDHNNLTISSCDFKDCTSDSYGGAIHIYDCKNCRILSCNFTDCSSKWGGGAIAVENYEIYDCIINSCNFINCHYQENITSKEAILIRYQDTATVEDCTYKDIARPANTTPATVPVKIAASDLSMMYTAGSPFKVTVYGTDGNPANGTSVVIKVNGKTVKTLTANANGTATYKPTQTPGSYKISATALGKTVTKKLTVKRLVTLKAVTVKKSAKKLVLQATLGKVNGKYLKSKQVTFKFNGKTYKAKTSSKGVAKVTIKSSVLKKLKVGKKVTYQATYLKDTAKKTAKVVK